MSADTVQTILAEATATLKKSGIDSAALDASVLLAHVLGVERSQLRMDSGNLLNNNKIEEFNALIERRKCYEPIAYIIGKKEFWSLDFCVTPDTLIPRPDSETLIAAALKRVRERAKPITILDIGTGTSCLLVTLLKELPLARGVGVDNSEPALQVARENAKRHGVEHRVELVHSHWCDALRGTFDLIISNPPYIAQSAYATLMPDVARFEPRAALIAGADGLDAYRALAPQITKFLDVEGYTLLEVGEGQAEAVSELLEKEGLKTETIEKDLAGIPRCVVARWRKV